LRMKVNRTVILWSLAFAVLAIISGLFLLSAVESDREEGQHGYFAEGFFLVLVLWVVVLVGVAKLATRLKEGPRKKDEF